jgi:MarR family 2-MHQ and catechol resistance regulon transcriptional repressor
MTTNVKLMVVLSKLANSFHDPLTRNLESLGISSSIYLSLAHLNSVEKAKTQRLGEVALISSGTITHTVNKMVKEELIEKIQDTEDKRVYWVKITDKGRALFENVHIEHMKYLDQLLSDFSEEEKLEFIEQVKYFGIHIAQKK